MQYKTIVLQYLRQHPSLHNQLKTAEPCSRALDRWASELKTSHEAWKEQLSQANPGDDPSQIANQALEFALKDLAASLPTGSSRTTAIRSPSTKR